MNQSTKIISILAFIFLATASSFAQGTNDEQVRVQNNILSGEALGEFEPYKPESGNIMARGHNFYVSANTQYSAGIWQAKSGSMSVKSTPYAEIMYLVEGSVKLNTGNNTAVTYNAGEGIVIPKGWSGTFAVGTSGVTAIYSTYTNDDMASQAGADIILLDRDTLAGLRFADFRPFDADVSDIVARNHEFYRTSDQKFGVDVWEAQPGEVPFADLGYDEMIYVLEGNMSFINTNGDAQIYSEGKAVVLPQGWNGKGVVSTSGARVMIFWYFHGERN